MEDYKTTYIPFLVSLLTHPFTHCWLMYQGRPRNEEDFRWSAADIRGGGTRCVFWAGSWQRWRSQALLLHSTVTPCWVKVCLLTWWPAPDVGGHDSCINSWHSKDCLEKSLGVKEEQDWRYIIGSPDWQFFEWILRDLQVSMLCLVSAWCFIHIASLLYVRKVMKYRETASEMVLFIPAQDLLHWVSPISLLVGYKAELMPDLVMCTSRSESSAVCLITTLTSFTSVGCLSWGSPWQNA